MLPKWEHDILTERDTKNYTSYVCSCFMYPCVCFTSVCGCFLPLSSRFASHCSCFVSPSGRLSALFGCFVSPCSYFVCLCSCLCLPLVVNWQRFNEVLPILCSNIPYTFTCLTKWQTSPHPYVKPFEDALFISSHDIFTCYQWTCLPAECFRFLNSTSLVFLSQLVFKRVTGNN